MGSNKHIVKCYDCGLVLNEATDIPAEQRIPCPECGSIKRDFKIALEGTVHVHSLLGIKARSPKVRKPYMEQRVGNSLQYSTGRWMKIQRVIDRLKNWYSGHLSIGGTGSGAKRISCSDSIDESVSMAHRPAFRSGDGN